MDLAQQGSKKRYKRIDNSLNEFTYVIMCGGDYTLTHNAPRPLYKVNGESLLERIIRLLQKNSVNTDNIIISSNDPIFDGFKVKRKENLNNNYVSGDWRKKIPSKGYWVDAFLPMNTPTVYLYGDVYYSENCIKTIVTSARNITQPFILVGSNQEPYGFIVKDTNLFQKHINLVKKAQDEGKLIRPAITWEVYRSLNNLDLNKHQMLDKNYIKILDDTIDIDDKRQVHNVLQKKFAKNRYYTNVFYIDLIYDAGGVETFLYNLVQKYIKKDIVIFYGKASEAQLERLYPYCEVYPYSPDLVIQCKNFFGFFANPIAKKVIAENYYFTIHGDYKALGVAPPKNSVGYNPIAVSQVVADSWYDYTKESPIVSYNPVIVKKPKKILHLITASRLSREKGAKRIEKLAQLFDDNNIPFKWDIYSPNLKNAPIHPSIFLHNTKLDLTNEIADADYLVQLSDTESFGYSIAEALMLKTPVIITDCPVFKELKIQNGIDGFIVDFDLENVDVQKIYTSHLKPTWTAPQDSWNTILDNHTEKSLKDYNYKYEVVATDQYKKQNIIDVGLGKIPQAGETWIINQERLKILQEAPYQLIEVKNIIKD